MVTTIFALQSLLKTYNFIQSCFLENSAACTGDWHLRAKEWCQDQWQWWRRRKLILLSMKHALNKVILASFDYSCGLYVLLCELLDEQFVLKTFLHTEFDLRVDFNYFFFNFLPESTLTIRRPPSLRAWPSRRFCRPSRKRSASSKAVEKVS